METDTQQTNRQIVFNKVVSHLLTQNNKAFILGNAGVCAYLNAEGKQCAAGCLIAKENYSPKFEQILLTEGGDRAYPIRKAIAKSLGFEPDFGLISKLQCIHDDYEVIDWRIQLAAMANYYHLSTKVLNSI